jgi:uncharacterized repeat protein (TIGR04076 family)
MTMNYSLYDLEIVTAGDPATFNCSHVVGQGLVARGENISFKPGTTQFSHYALATLVPYIAAKQRAVDAADWMTYESEIRCPDPACGARFVLKQLGKATYDYSPPTSKAGN